MIAAMIVAACASTTIGVGATTEVAEVANVAPFTPADYKALVVHLDTDRCWQAILELKPYADALGTPLICGNAEYEGEELAGLFIDGVAHVGITGDPARWFQLVGAHELGHAWDWRVLYADNNQASAQAILGWDSWDQEAWARIYQAAIGYWDDDDHPNITKPSAGVLNVLRSVGLLPQTKEQA